MTQTHDQKCFTIWEVAADWHELMTSYYLFVAGDWDILCVHAGRQAGRWTTAVQVSRSLLQQRQLNNANDNISTLQTVSTVINGHVH